MRLRATMVLADAWAAWRADWPVLASIAGAFLFLPQLAVLMLVPRLGDLLPPVISPDPDDPSFQAAVAIMADWMARYGPWQIAAALVVLFGQFVIVVWYLRGDRPIVGRALIAALRLLPRMVLASLVWMVPLGMLQFVLLAAAPVLYFPVAALVMARMLLVGPALVVDRPVGALAAIGSSVRSTRGTTWMLGTLVLGVLIAQLLFVVPLDAADHWMKVNAPNPIARAIVDALTAIVATLGGVAMALLQVGAWRNLR